jgi:predicted phosphohydrolase
MSLLWTNDLHFNFLRQKNAAFMFAQYIAEENPNADGLIIAGDISSGEVLEDHLSQLAKGFPKPIYFVLGNHDFYNRSFDETTSIVTGLAKKFKNLCWLNQNNQYNKGLSIVGVGGWYDAYFGNEDTSVDLSDFSLIQNLRTNYREHLFEIIRNKSKEEAKRLNSLLLDEIYNVDADVVLVVTHVPPFSGAAWHEGNLCDRDWQPWFTSRLTGEVLDKFAELYPEKKFIVLTGHTHSPGIYERQKNLIIYTGKAIYGTPDLAGIIDGDKIIFLDSDGNKIERKL